MRILSLIALLALTSGCASNRIGFYENAKRAKDDDRMIETIKTIVPIGTPIDEAQRRVEHEGFECKLSEQDSLVCKRNESAGFMVSRRWVVALVHRDGKVAEVLVRSELTGP